jgi:hypothetical protein
MASANTDTATSFLVDANGAVLTAPTVMLSDADAGLLREYKKFLQRNYLREALYCADCWTGEREDGCEAHVTSGDILIKCRCKIRLHKGQSF